LTATITAMSSPKPTNSISLVLSTVVNTPVYSTLWNHSRSV
jgi:hypothetical protein